MDDVKPKLKEPKIVMDEWRKLVKDTKVFVIGGQKITHYFGESGDCIATGLGEGPYHLQLFIFHHIEAMLEYKAAKAIEEEVERAEREAAKLAKQNAK